MPRNTESSGERTKFAVPISWKLLTSTIASGEATGELEAVTSGAGHDLQPCFSHNGERLAYSIQRLNSDIYRLPIDPATGRPTGREAPLVETVKEDSRGSWSQDMKFVAFNSDRRDGNMNIWIHNLATGEKKRITSGPGGDYQAQWTPDGKTLVFFSGRSGNGDIWAVDVASGALTQLTHASKQDINPFVSRDGQYIAFQSDRDGRNYIWLMNMDGSNQQKLSQEGVLGHFSPWHPDPTRQAIAYSFNARSANKYYVVLRSVPDIDNHTEERIQLSERLRMHHSFSPDGEALMDLRNHQTIYYLSLSEGSHHDVFEFPDPNDKIDYPVWSPDGKWVLFDRQRLSGADIWIIDLAADGIP